MKILCIIVGFAIVFSALFAGDDITEPEAHFLCPDRIRNVIAVDDADNQNFYAATFGLDNYEYSAYETTPLGKEALLIRFTVHNSILAWELENIATVRMNSIQLNLGTSVSSYNTVDINNINASFSSVEAQQRVGSALDSGPVPFCTGNFLCIIIGLSS